MTKQRFTIEWMQNGLIRLYDYGCEWTVVFNADGSYRHGGCDNAKYRAAVREWLETRQS